MGSLELTLGSVWGFSLGSPWEGSEMTLEVQP